MIACGSGAGKTLVPREVAPAKEAAAGGEIVRAEMVAAAELAVPLVVDVGVGDTWYDAKA